MATMQICLRTLIVPPVFSVASPKSCYIRPALHPGARRCSSVAYSRYAPSSRLARRAHRRPRCEQDFGDATLDLAQLAAAKLAIEIERLPDDADRVLDAEHVFDDDLLVLECLVVLEEAADFTERVAGNLFLVGVFGERR